VGQGGDFWGALPPKNFLLEPPLHLYTQPASGPQERAAI